MIASVMVCCAAGCEQNDFRSRNAQPDLVAPALGVLHHNYTMKDLVGDALGPTGGMIIAAAPEKFENHMGKEAIDVNHRADETPARAIDVRDAETADLNGDGYITLDEVIALKQAGLTDTQIMNRLRATPQVYSLTPHQADYLTDRGISHAVVEVIRDLMQLNAPATQPAV
ncbi:MAG TPA: hypothetical protein VH370_16675 [Humisphaera sp.]|jgi:hypothetical protein|nr:hypothetical protein [Humisphaera sp.]